MADCEHKKCRKHLICGEISGTVKNPGGNIHTPGQLYKHKGHKLLGWHSPQESHLYNEMVRALNSGTIVEVGVFGGASLLGVIESCQQTDSHIYGVDPWDKIIIANGMPMPKDQQTTYRERIKKIRLNLENIIQCEKYDTHATLIHDFSVNAALQFGTESVDVVFIDGDHSYDAVLEDMSAWFPTIKQGGTMWGDDYGGWESVRMAVKDYCKDNGVEFQVVCGQRAWRIVK